MLIEGVKLMVVGMVTVMLFLLLMILFINLVSSLTKKSAARELAEINKERQLAAQNRKNAINGSSADGDTDIAVITAAVAAYEAELFAVN